MPCQDCRDYSTVGCNSVSSTCVTWQGKEYEDLNICLGRSLSYVNNIILDKITDLLKGKGIILEDLTISDCQYIQDLLGVKEKNLLNILDVYKQAICNLKESQDITQEQLNSFTNIAGYTLKCITNQDPCGDPLTFKSLIQAIIDKVCALNTQLENIAESLLDVVEEGAGNFLINGAITSCGGNGFKTSGTGASAVVTFQALVPPNCPIIYTGSTQFFNANGVGLPNTPFCGWFLCNGANNTPNPNTLPQGIAGNTKYIMRFD